MDANGQRFFLLADAAHWRGLAHVRHDAGCAALELASERTLVAALAPAAAFAVAGSALEAIPRALDEGGALGCWNGAEGAVVARSTLPGEAVRLPLPAVPSDLLVSHDGVLHALVAGGVRLHDLRGRWADVTVSDPGFVPWRAAADPSGAVWLLERASGRIARLEGRPPGLGIPREYDGRTFRPDPENGCAPGLRQITELAWEPGERPVAIACDVDGPALLSWIGGDGISRVRRLDPRRLRLGPAQTLAGVAYAYALALADDGRLLVRVPGRVDAPCYRWPAGERAQTLIATGEVCPLPAEALEAPFAHRLSGPPQVPVAIADGALGAAPLHALSIANRAPAGEARHWDGEATKLLDSGAPQTVWHRLYAEARIPARCGFTVWLAATPLPQPPAADDRRAWVPHRFGETPAPDDPQVAQAAWDSRPSELAHHPGLAAWPREPGRAGLFSVLIQNPRQRVRRLVGRYLWMRVVLNGDRRATPQIAALRAWSSRFSYRDQYLPRFYREAEHGAPAEAPGELLDQLEPQHAAALDAGGVPADTLLARLREAGIEPGSAPAISVETPGLRWQLRDGGSGRVWPLQREAGGHGVSLYRPQATPADFLERMLANFEGLLTPIEDRIAEAHRLTDPASVPDASLDWLAAWVGVAFDAALPPARRRDWLAAAAELARHHGTRRGLVQALDLATGGGVRGGEIVVIEDFRLRRTLSTLIGVDLNDDDDPLLPGLIVSGNSVVGDTLFVGDTEIAERAELLALFRDEVTTAAEDRAVLAFDARLAHRATVFVHQAVEPQDLGLIRRIVALEAPAHVEVRVVSASQPFLVGVRSLVGVDSYLAPRPPRRPATVQRSVLGGGDFLIAPASLDPRMAGASPAANVPPPVARAAGPGGEVASLGSFVLDGSGSAAAPGRRIVTYRWRRLPPDVS